MLLRGRKYSKYSSCAPSADHILLTLMLMNIKLCICDALNIQSGCVLTLIYVTNDVEMGYRDWVFETANCLLKQDLDINIFS